MAIIIGYNPDGTPQYAVQSGGQYSPEAVTGAISYLGGDINQFINSYGLGTTESYSALGKKFTDVGILTDTYGQYSLGSFADKTSALNNFISTATPAIVPGANQQLVGGQLLPAIEGLNTLSGRTAELQQQGISSTGVVSPTSPINPQNPSSSNYQASVTTPTTTTATPTAPTTTYTPPPAIPTTIDANQLTASTATPTLPPLTAPTVFATTLTGIAQQAESARTAVEEAYKTQITQLQADQEEAQAKIDELTGKQEGILENNVQPLLQPWREQLETAERERLKIEQNYFANQAAVEELNQLLTEGNAVLEQMKGVTGLASIRNPRIAQAAETIAARAGVIQAVMAARNNQISVASNLIDRSMTAIAADKNDQLQYFNSLLNFYDGQKKDAQSDLANLTATERQYINAQIGLLENDLARANQTADYIKGLMINPETANILQQSGVTLNDTPEQIQAKFAQYSYREEVRNISNTMAQQGAQYIPTGSSAPAGTKAFTITDSQGKTYTYAVPQDVKTTIIEQNGRQVLINAQTGQLISDLGALPPNTSILNLPDGRTVLVNSQTGQIINTISTTSPQAAATANQTAAQSNYEYYKTQEQAAGRTPVSFAEFGATGGYTAPVTPGSPAGTGYTNTQTVTAINNLDKITRNLEPGMSGEDVMALQNFLKSQGYQVNLTGTYDQATVDAVTQLQQKLGVDYGQYPGYFGPVTKKALGITSTTGGTSGTTSTKTTESQAVLSMESQLGAVKGADGYISPTDWTKAKQAWVAAGYSLSSFESNFSKYQNPYDPVGYN